MNKGRNAIPDKTGFTGGGGWGIEIRFKFWFMSFATFVSFAPNRRYFRQNESHSYLKISQLGIGCSVLTSQIQDVGEKTPYFRMHLRKIEESPQIFSRMPILSPHTTEKKKYGKYESERISCSKNERENNRRERIGID